MRSFENKSVYIINLHCESLGLYKLDKKETQNKKSIYRNVYLLNCSTAFVCSSPSVAGIYFHLSTVLDQNMRIYFNTHKTKTNSFIRNCAYHDSFAGHIFTFAQFVFTSSIQKIVSETVLPLLTSMTNKNKPSTEKGQPTRRHLLHSKYYDSPKTWLRIVRLFIFWICA